MKGSHTRRPRVVLLHLKSLRLNGSTTFVLLPFLSPLLSLALAKIVRESYPDHTAFDPKSDYFDDKSNKEDPRWFMVDVQFNRKLKRILTLKELQQYKDKELKDMKLLNRGRLSVQPVSNAEMEFIMELEKKKAAEQ